MDESTTSPISKLPSDLLAYIFEFVLPQDYEPPHPLELRCFLSTALVCKFWSPLVQSHALRSFSFSRSLLGGRRLYHWLVDNGSYLNLGTRVTRLMIRNHVHHCSRFLDLFVAEGSSALRTLSLAVPEDTPSTPLLAFRPPTSEYDDSLSIGDFPSRFPHLKKLVLSRFEVRMDVEMLLWIRSLNTFEQRAGPLTLDIDDTTLHELAHRYSAISDVVFLGSTPHLPFDLLFPMLKTLKIPYRYQYELNPLKCLEELEIFTLPTLIDPRVELSWKGAMLENLQTLRLNSIPFAFTMLYSFPNLRILSIFCCKITLGEEKLEPLPTLKGLRIYPFVKEQLEIANEPAILTLIQSPLRKLELQFRPFIVQLLRDHTYLEDVTFFPPSWSKNVMDPQHELTSLSDLPKGLRALSIDYKKRILAQSIGSDDVETKLEQWIVSKERPSGLWKLAVRGLKNVDRLEQACEREQVQLFSHLE
ncbi:hypothetical protein BT69DRAFT_1285876 [Atractiella rhizophila]|nr:hypothetical protein BT69DRAFT_1285876 [Atractiella rhizophila]